MSDSALPKLAQLIEQLIAKNAAHTQEISRLAGENETLTAQVKQLEDDNEILQMEALEYEENNVATLEKINTMVGRIEQQEA